MIGNTIRCFHGARLGNQLFQISMLFSIKKKTNQSYFQVRKNEQFWKCFDVDIPDNGQTNKHRGDYGCPYQYYKDVYELGGGTSFDGYFQNILYVEDIRDELIHFFKFKNEHEEYSLNFLDKIKQKFNLPITSIHIRRGDYLNSERILGNLTKSNYYKDSILDIKKDVCYLIFSDDINWCKENFNITNCEFIDCDEYKSLCLMTKTDYNIIANSTFSWWGAFLNKTSKTFAPSMWMGPAYKVDCSSHLNFILQDWKKIEVSYNYK